MDWPIIKGNIYSLSFKNVNKWMCFSDFNGMTKHKLSNSESFSYSSNMWEEKYQKNYVHKFSSMLWNV